VRLYRTVFVSDREFVDAKDVEAEVRLLLRRGGIDPDLGFRVYRDFRAGGCRYEQRTGWFDLLVRIGARVGALGRRIRVES
jgi:hypothetical protein